MKLESLKKYAKDLKIIPHIGIKVEELTQDPKNLEKIK